MDEFDFDEMENSYSKAVLNKKKNKKKGTQKKVNLNTSNTKIDEKKVLLFAIIISAFVIFIILSIINIQFKEAENNLNTDIVDELNYIENIEGEGINPEEMVSKGKNDTDSKLSDETSNDEVKQAVQALEEEDKQQNISDEKLTKYYAIQIGASGDLDLVDKKISEIEDKGYSAYYLEEGTKKYMYKMLIEKKFKTREKATAYAQDLKDKGIISDFWVRYFNE